MIENNNFPWYLQQSPIFLALYTGFFDVAVAASPLGIGDALNIDEMHGAQLYNIGTYWGMTGSPYIWNGLIYDIDNWSEIKTWTGGLEVIGERLYSNIIKAKAYAYGRVYSLTTLKNVLDIVFADYEHTITVDEYGSMAVDTIDNGSVTGTVDETTDCGSVEDIVDSITDCGSLTSTDVPIHRVTINITAAEEIIRAFIETKAYDVAFIGKPVGIQVNWQYNYII